MQIYSISECKKICTGNTYILIDVYPLKYTLVRKKVGCGRFPFKLPYMIVQIFHSHKVTLFDISTTHTDTEPYNSTNF